MVDGGTGRRSRVAALGIVTGPHRDPEEVGETMRIGHWGAA